MKKELIKILICPFCKNNLNLEAEKADREVKEGNLRCKGCDRNYPIFHYISRFVSSDRYTKSFSLEWKLHRETQLDLFSGTKESEETFKKKTGFDLEQLKGKLILDVGCGAGRFIEVAEKYGAEVVGVDLSFSVDEAWKNLKNKSNIHLIQADIFKLPLKEESFDYIFSIGVLHHTPNTKEAFKQLPKLLKEGGEIAIWVYSNEGFKAKIYNRWSNFLRIFTIRLPADLLYRLSYISIPLYYLKRIKILGKLFSIIPISMHPETKWRVLDTFDWYSPKYQWKHTHKEVRQWFEEEGLKDITQLDFPVAIRAKK